VSSEVFESPVESESVESEPVESENGLELKNDGELDSYVEIDNLTFYRDERLIFDDISIRIPRGKVTAIMGPSGTGKTTLLKLIGGQLKPNRGVIRVDGQDISRLSRKELYVAREKMGMLFQSGALFSDLSVFENVAFPLRVHTRLPEEMIRDIVLMKLEAVGLRGARDLMPSQLSGGMTRRVALARSIVLDPAMIMYDEPFAGQDPIAMGMLVKLIRLLNDSLGLTSILVSHDVVESTGISDYLIILADGKVIGQGSPAQLRQADSELVRQFMNGLPDGPVPFHYPAATYGNDLLGV
jgi:phospholipid/cholesterol/gamma-HCH transport system ATP-binding protein